MNLLNEWGITVVRLLHLRGLPITGQCTFCGFDYNKRFNLDTSNPRKTTGFKCFSVIMIVSERNDKEKYNNNNLCGT